MCIVIVFFFRVYILFLIYYPGFSITTIVVA